VVPVFLTRPEHQAYVGRTLADIAASRGQDWIDAAIDLLVAENQGSARLLRTWPHEDGDARPELPAA
jgi:N-acyl-D-aspartate/D-glutamate deacylase